MSSSGFSSVADPASNVVSKVRQSPRLEFPGTIDDSWLAGKTILITGGASGFGAACVKRWATAKACVIFGDINVPKGKAVEAEIRASTKNQNVHFIECNVSDWASQVSFFKTAVKLSPHGGIDSVVANAGISDQKMTFMNPKGLDAENPPPLDMKVLDVNITGVVYTAHLALFWLPRNPGSKPASPTCDPDKTERDRHLLLVGSLASIGPIPLQAFYGASKHAVLGLFRCMRADSFVHGVRVSFLAPYFVETPIVPTIARMVLAGASLGSVEDVVESMTRLTADPRIVGRAICVAPKLRSKVLEDGTVCLAPVGEPGSEEKGIWELHADDFEAVEVWNRRFIGLLNAAEKAKGWTGWAIDMVKAARYGILGW